MDKHSTAPHLAAGELCEDLACRYLCSNGMRLLERNFRCRHGEIDLVMQAGSCLVIVEVRYRRSPHYGGAAATVNSHKQRRIIKTTQYLLQQKPAYQQLPVRFDVVAIAGELKNADIEWLPRAFSTDGII